MGRARNITQKTRQVKREKKNSAFQSRSCMGLAEFREAELPQNGTLASETERRLMAILPAKVSIKAASHTTMTNNND
jgi:hypothetical protein